MRDIVYSLSEERVKYIEDKETLDRVLGEFFGCSTVHDTFFDDVKDVVENTTDDSKFLEENSLILDEDLVEVRVQFDVLEYTASHLFQVQEGLI